MSSKERWKGSDLLSTKKKAEVTFTTNTSQFNKGIKQMNASLKELRAELKLNATQMKSTGTNTDALKQKQSILKQELADSRQKTALLNNKLQEAVKIYGSNSVEAKNLSAAVTNAKNAEASIQNEINQVNVELKNQEKANSSLVQSIKKADNEIETLNKELTLNETRLEGATDKTDLLKERQMLLADQSKAAADKVKSLEEALDLCGQEVGENSEEYAELSEQLIEAKTQQAAIQNEIKDTTEELSDQKTKLQEVGDKLETFGSGMEKAGQAAKAMSAVAAAGLTGAGAAAISFESAFAGVQKTVDEVYDANGRCTYSYEELEDGIRNMAKEIPATVTEISEVAEAAGQLGIKTEDVLGFTRVMIDMGESTNLSSDVAAESIAKFANITGLAADETMSAQEKYGRLGSTIVELGNNYATTEADIMDMAQNLASAGTQVGMSESDILALAASLSSVGLEAQAGGTAFSKAMIEMQLAVETNSDSLQDWASVAGMSAEEFGQAFREDATGALQAFIKGLSECGGESESAIKVLDDMGITETRMRDALLRSANASDVFTSAIQKGKDAWEDNTALTEEAEKRYETTASQIGIMKNEIVDAGISLGSVFLPIINQGVKKVSDFAEKISGMSEGSLKVAAGILAVVAVLSPVLIGIGKISTGISAVIGIGSKLSGLFAGVGAAGTSGGAAAAAGMALPLGPILAIVAGVAAIIAIFVLLWNKSESFREFFIGMWEGFKETIDGFLEKINFSEKVEDLKEKFAGLADKLSGLGSVFQILATIGSVLIIPMVATISGLFNAFLTILDSALTTLGGCIDMLSGLGDIIVGVFTGDMDLAKQGCETFASGVSSVFSGLWGMVTGALSSFLQGIIAFFSSLFATSGISGFFSSVINGFSDMKSKASEKVSGICNSVKTKFSEIKTSISDKINAARDAVKNAIDKIKSFFNFSWSLPKLKMPHINITGSFSLMPPSAPHFEIKWYAKGAVFKKPTLFNTSDGLKGVGEAGAEAVLPIDNLRNYIREEMEYVMDKVQADLGNEIDYDRLAAAMAKQNIVLMVGERPFGRLVREVI